MELPKFEVFRRDGFVYAVSDHETLVCEPTINAARAALLPELVRLAHGGRQWLCIVHAAACAFDNRCLLLPASSHSGKTTLMVALMQEGFEFLSDDSAAIDRETRYVAPMPFALMVREGSWNILQPRYPELRNTPVLSRDAEVVRFLRPRAVAKEARPAAFVFPKFLPEGEPVFRRIDSFRALLRLQESGFWTPHDPVSIRAFLDWAQSLPAYDFNYSDLDQAVNQIRLLLQQPG